MPTTPQHRTPHDPSQDPSLDPSPGAAPDAPARRDARRARAARRWSWLAAPGVVAVGAAVLAGTALTGGPAPEAQAAVPDHLLAAANAERQVTTAAAWFSAQDLRTSADARVEAERVEAERVAAEQARLAAEAAAAEAARLAEEARAAAAAEATRSAQRDPRGVARALAGERGWGESQFSCLDSLWTKESGWDHTADNPTSSAYGIPQALPGSKMASAGADWETNPVTQITWGLQYIENRYGTPCSAWAHSKANNWY
ncbi:aggregation-promoting factor C-terminal-like domain-containing protein [Kineococcus sp. SYSU DK005]|uniref:aggregation-promoting factor C-terminal-like domain-containing protein n=1 Tax=Kineococcus sp. SYSU DK005 TaxID=3383126 RepID=UPI003D7D93EB